MNPKAMMKGMKMPPRQMPSIEVEIGEGNEAEGEGKEMETESGIDLSALSDEEILAEVEKRGLLA